MKPAPSTTPRIATPIPIAPLIPDPAPITRLAIAAFFVWLAAEALLLGAGGALENPEEDATMLVALPLLAFTPAASGLAVVGRTVVVAPAGSALTGCETLTVLTVLWETLVEEDNAPEELERSLCFDVSDVEAESWWSDSDVDADAEDGRALVREPIPVAVGAAVADPA
ncbi:hypothetical protein TRAPUB_8946 [Trametes pubescens]|uniref:Uncharacterized protein n=1 Tax=Trametes pubescens TaxID=154538 RepID=A0A1M2W3Z3_TRAPU|nr:hypothetical protein TRAPUB_8946 [Trametes pubescens]